MLVEVGHIIHFSGLRGRLYRALAGRSIRVRDRRQSRARNCRRARQKRMLWPCSSLDRRTTLMLSLAAHSPPSQPATMRLGRVPLLPSPLSLLIQYHSYLNQGHPVCPALCFVGCNTNTNGRLGRRLEIALYIASTAALVVLSNSHRNGTHLVRRHSWDTQLE